MTEAITMKTILKQLYDHQKNVGFRYFKDEEDPNMPLFDNKYVLISKDEWNAVFAWSGLAPRVVTYWWKVFNSLEYLVPTQQSNKTKDVLLNLEKIKEDIDIRTGKTPDQFLGVI